MNLSFLRLGWRTLARDLRAARCGWTPPCSNR